MVVVSFAVCCPLYEYLWRETCGPARLTDMDPWDWRSELLIKLPVHAILTEVAFYACHYLLHQSPVLYQHVHKVHHRFRAPTAPTCVYAHPLEFALANVGAIYAGPIFCNSHPWTCYLWWMLATAGTCKGHCGYQIWQHVDYHDHHHQYASKQKNLGAMVVSDLLFGTMYIPDTIKAKD